MVEEISVCLLCIEGGCLSHRVNHTCHLACIVHSIELHNRLYIVILTWRPLAPSGSGLPSKVIVLGLHPRIRNFSSYSLWEYSLHCSVRLGTDYCSRYSRSPTAVSPRTAWEQYCATERVRVETDNNKRPLSISPSIDCTSFTIHLRSVCWINSIDPGL